MIYDVERITLRIKMLEWFKLRQALFMVELKFIRQKKKRKRINYKSWEPWIKCMKIFKVKLYLCKMNIWLEANCMKANCVNVIEKLMIRGTKVFV